MKIGTDILWLTEKDVADLFSIRDALAAVEEAFRLTGEGNAQLPSKIYLTFEPYSGDLRAMPAYLKGKNPRAGVKIVNSTPDNPSKGLPAVSGVMVAVDPETGLVTAILAAGMLTALRTGAGGGVAAKYLARKNSSVVGLVGCGRQASTQLEALAAVFSVRHVKVWGVKGGESDQFIQRWKKKSPVSFESVTGPKEACDADIVVTTTPVRSPIVKSEWIKKGTHINAIGADAPGKQELDVDVLTRSKIVVDDWAQASHGGEINKAVSGGRISEKDIIGSLGDVITGKKKARSSDDDITVFDSTGLAVQDVASAAVIVEKAVNLNKGRVLTFYG